MAPGRGGLPGAAVSTVDPKGGDMRVEQRDDGWWIVNTPGTFDDCGSYETRALAVSDMLGMKKFFKFEHNPSFFNGRS